MASSRAVSLLSVALLVTASGCGDGTSGSTHAAPPAVSDSGANAWDGGQAGDASIADDPVCRHDHVGWGWIGGELSFESRSASLVACSGMEIVVTPRSGPSVLCASVLPGADTAEIATALNRPEVLLALRASGTYGCVYELDRQMRIDVAGVTVIVATPRRELEARGVTRGFTCATDDVPAGLTALRTTLGRIVDDSPESRACFSDGGR